MKLRKERTLVRENKYALVFDLKGRIHVGFSFDCDENGNILWDNMHPAAGENLAMVLTDHAKTESEREYELPFVREFTNTYTQPGEGACDRCGHTVYLYDAFTNTCDRCGTDYDGRGRRLASRLQWGEETGETASDILYGNMPKGWE